MDINEDSLKDTTSKGLTFHKMIEAIKFAYGKRFELGDADFVPGVREVMHLPCEQNSTFCLTTSMVMGTDCIGSCKFNYHTIMATTAPALNKLKIMSEIFFIMFCK
jgi:hypothetical protein